MSTLSTRNLTILLTDIKGFTDKTSRKSRGEILEMLERHKAVLLPVLEGRGGKLVKTIGDAFLMVFESPTDAVLAGVAVQEALRAHNQGREEDDRLDVRVAINTGEVNLADNDIFGEPVNITARIEAVAEAGEVFFTEAVYLAMNKKEVPSSEIGLLQLKGIPEKVRVYKVKREEPVSTTSAAQKARPDGDPAPKAQRVAHAAPAVSATSASRPPLAKRAAALLIDLILCGVVVGFLFPNHHRRLDSKRATKVKAAVAKAAATGTIKIDDGDDEEDEQYSSGRRWAWAWPLTWFVYSLVFLKRLGTTPGGRILKLAVVREDGKPLEKGDWNTRAAFSVLSGYCLGLGYLWALWEKDGRGWHDLMARTRVVETA